MPTQSRSSNCGRPGACGVRKSAGSGSIAARNYSVLVLIPEHAHHKRLSIPYTVARDAAFDAWFAGFPDLDAEDRRQTEAAIAADPRFDSTPAERLQRLAAARVFAQGFNLLAL